MGRRQRGGLNGGRVSLLSPLLAVLLAVGLAAMHTLGHIGGPAPCHSAGRQPAHYRLAHCHDAYAPSAAPGDAGGHRSPASATHGGTTHGGEDPGGEDPRGDAAAVCLAILAALVVFAVPLLHLAGLIVARTRDRLPAEWHLAATLRGPPAALVLMRTVVLRT
ncbi:hypothetical protein MF672_015880 [Actinomadura sp. ATCC 31491]|uniref:Uncharacterized protein n=1 Tax=Actinomadura luzonensis TaxID=2805427 RepID=A0ABT0FSG0_9ACTN|nr:hypothetical protein [Actinomadura luzonensis]MCK2215256.1 hypothetical protein [Actinomadura luzonensis]